MNRPLGRSRRPPAMCANERAQHGRIERLVDHRDRSADPLDLLGAFRQNQIKSDARIEQRGGFASARDRDQHMLGRQRGPEGASKRAQAIVDDQDARAANSLRHDANSTPSKENFTTSEASAASVPAGTRARAVPARFATAK